MGQYDRFWGVWVWRGVAARNTHEIVDVHASVDMARSVTARSDWPNHRRYSRRFEEATTLGLDLAWILSALHCARSLPWLCEGR
jgi:hypothetical protein